MGLDQAGELANATPRAEVGLLCWETREPVCMDRLSGGWGQRGEWEKLKSKVGRNKIIKSP